MASGLSTEATCNDEAVRQMAQNLGHPVPPSQNPSPKREGGGLDEQLHGLSSNFAPFPDPNLTVHQRLRELAEEVGSIAGRGSCVIGLLEGEEFLCRASAGEAAPGLGAQIHIQDDLLIESLRSRRSQVCQDTLSDPRVDAAACNVTGVRSIMVVPLLAQDKGKLIGILEASSPDSHAFGTAVTERVEAVGRRIVGLLASAEDRTRGQVTEPAANDLPRKPEIPPERKWEVPLARPAVSASKVPAETPPKPAQDPAPPLVNNIPVAPQVLTPSDRTPARNIPSAATASVGDSFQGPRKTSPQNLTLAFGVLAAACVLAVLLAWLQQEKLRQATVAANSAPVLALHTDASQPGASPHPGSAADDRRQTNSGSIQQPAREGGVRQPATGNSISGDKPAGRKRVFPKEPNLPQGGLVVYEKGKVIYRDGQSVNSQVASLAAGSTVADSMTAPITPAAETERLEETANPASKAVTRGQSRDSGETFTGGKLLHRLPPAYPPEALAARLEGDVVLQGVIGKDGAVRDVRVVSGDPRLTHAAAEAVLHWRYDPFRSGGEPVDMLSTLTVHFRLPRAPNQ